MIVMGDEVRRTQGGNNNVYCQDNETSWFDWSLVEKHADVHRFVKLLIARRLLRDTRPEQQRMSLNSFLKDAKKAWHGVRLFEPDWSPWSHTVALGAELAHEDLVFHFIMNAYWEDLEFSLPPANAPWRRWIDTSLESPLDIVDWLQAAPVAGSTYRAAQRSVAVLINRRG
jgi:glycogen operon protein